MENNKSPGNDGLSKEFYECFWGGRLLETREYVHKQLLLIINTSLNKKQLHNNKANYYVLASIGKILVANHC